MIKIIPDVPGRIKLAFPYSPEIVAKVRTVNGRQWHPHEKYWSFPNSKEALSGVLSALAGEEIEIHPSLQSLVPPFQAGPLLDRVRHLIRLKHYSIRTEKSYLPWIEKYLRFHHSRDPKEMAGKDIEAYLSHLAVNLKVSASTQNQAFNALLFLYREVLKKEWVSPSRPLEPSNRRDCPR